MGRKIKIRQIGNSHGIIIPKSILEEYGFKNGDLVDISSNGKPIILSKVDGKNDKDKKNR